MMEISTSQMDAMGGLMAAEYRYRLIAYLRAKDPTVFGRFDDRELDRRIELATQSIRRHGPVSDEGLMKYATLVILAGDRLVSSDKIQGFLALPGFPIDNKIDWLVARVVQKLRDE